MVQVQARNIVRFAKKHGLKIKRWGVDDRGSCAVSVVASMLGVSYNDIWEGNYSNCNLDESDFRALEAGFENWDGCYANERYYKVGQNVARLAGVN